MITDMLIKFSLTDIEGMKCFADVAERQIAVWSSSNESGVRAEVKPEAVMATLKSQQADEVTQFMVRACYIYTLGWLEVPKGDWDSARPLLDEHSKLVESIGTPKETGPLVMWLWPM